MLRNCLRQLTPEEGEGEGKQEEDEEGSTGTEQGVWCGVFKGLPSLLGALGWGTRPCSLCTLLPFSAAQLHQSRVEKIHAMLDTSKVCYAVLSVSL